MLPGPVPGPDCFDVSNLMHLNDGKHNNLPPSPPALPVLGHLHLMKTAPHCALQSLSKKYAPIMYLRFGSRPVLVVTWPCAADECLSEKDVIFANQPRSLASKILGYNYTTLGFSPYGDHWRNIHAWLLSMSLALPGFRIFVGKKHGLWWESCSRGEKVNLKSLFF